MKNVSPSSLAKAKPAEVKQVEIQPDLNREFSPEELSFMMKISAGAGQGSTLSTSPGKK